MRKILSPEDAAIVLAIMMQRAGTTRSRVSDKTLRLISRRKRLEGSFRTTLNDELAELGYVIVPLDAGGQAVVKISALEAAKTLTASKVLSEQELRELRGGRLDIDGLRNELEDDEGEEVTE